jgi:ubiquinone/menaquinone biosynthesis C-methylase UbiE
VNAHHHLIDYNQLAADYARHRQVHPGVLLALCGAATPASRVLEVGCGTGNYISALQRQVGCACWGIDPSVEMLNRARKGSTAVTYRQASAEDLGFPPGTFDLVFSVDVIHHVVDRQAYLAQALAVLAPGGKICTATDSAWIIRHRQPLSHYFPETVEPELARYPRVADLRAGMARARFVQLDERTVECAYPLTDIQAYRAKAFSALHLISDAAFQRGIERMARDLRDGPIICTPRYTLLWGSKAPPDAPSPRLRRRHPAAGGVPADDLTPGTEETQ